MRIRAARRPTTRPAVTVVEAALVLFPLLLTIFSIFEYSRFVMFRQLMNLAAEEGCRYAVVHNQDADVLTKVQATVHQYMAGMDDTTNFAPPGVTVAVWQVDDNGTNIASTLSAVNAIEPGSPIAVQVSGSLSFMT